jgi:hypothetical protein
MQRLLELTKAATQRAMVRGCFGHFERLFFLLDESPNRDVRTQQLEAKIKRYEDQLGPLQAAIAEEERQRHSLTGRVKSVFRTLQQPKGSAE